jgi:DNA-binding LacI/PurR family transcriptional regulator
VTHLVELGHRRVAFLGGPLNSTTVQDRYTGYCAALMRVGEPLDERLVVPTPLSVEGGSQAVAGLLAAGASFSALFAATDEVAFGAISALREHGLRIPADVSVVGFDDVVMSAHSDPPLTTIRVPARELGLAAWRLLRAGETAAPPPCEQVPFELVRRGSTAPPTGDGPVAGVAAGAGATATDREEA